MDHLASLAFQMIPFLTNWDSRYQGFISNNTDLASASNGLKDISVPFLSIPSGTIVKLLQLKTVTFLELGPQLYRARCWVWGAHMKYHPLVQMLVIWQSYKMSWAVFAKNVRFESRSSMTEFCNRFVTDMLNLKSMHLQFQKFTSLFNKWFNVRNFINYTNGLWRKHFIMT